MVKGKKGRLWAGALILAGLLCLAILFREPDLREYETFSFVRPNSADVLLVREWHDFKDTGRPSISGGRGKSWPWGA